MKKPKSIRTLFENQQFYLGNEQQEKQIKKAIRIEKAILSFLPKKRRGFFQIGSKVVVLNLNNSLDKEVFKIGFIHAFELNQYGFRVEVLLPPYKSLYISTFEINKVYHSIKDLAQHNRVYLIERVKEYERIFREDNDTLPNQTKQTYKKIESQIIHVLRKSNLGESLYCM